MWESIVIEPKKKAQACFIMLHGLGASGADFSDFPELLGELPLPTRFIFPHAPLRPVSLNGGMVMPAWYDLFAIEAGARQDVEGLSQSAKVLCSLIESQIAQGISSANIMLAGFSQGGALALHTALSYPGKLAGIAALSSYLPPVERIAKTFTLPIALFHGSRDPVLPLLLAQTSYIALKQLGFPYEWHVYPIEHSICSEEMVDLKQWTQKCLIA